MVVLTHRQDWLGGHGKLGEVRPRSEFASVHSNCRLGSHGMLGGDLPRNRSLPYWPQVHVRIQLHMMLVILMETSW